MNGFKNAQRIQESALSGLEKRSLIWLAQHTPAAINSDHLTALGLVAMLGVGLSYWLAATQPLLGLSLAAVFLAINWLGDSLDGTLARYRQRTRPRYGFYVDHIVDAFGAIFVLLGLAVSGWITPGLAVAILVAYLLLSVNIALAACSRGTFKISYGPFGGTELRLLLAAVNTAVWLWPWVDVAGRSVFTFDVLGGVALGGVVLAVLRSVAQNTRALYDLERV